MRILIISLSVLFMSCLQSERQDTDSNSAAFAEASGKSEGEISITGPVMDGTLLFVPDLGAAFQPLVHVDFPVRTLFDNGSGGLNFEHIFNGAAADE